MTDKSLPQIHQEFIKHNKINACNAYVRSRTINISQFSVIFLKVRSIYVIIIYNYRLGSCFADLRLVFPIVVRVLEETAIALMKIVVH